MSRESLTPRPTASEAKPRPLDREIDRLLADALTAQLRTATLATMDHPALRIAA